MFSKDIIYNYIKKIKKDDIFNYGIKENIVLNNKEIDIIYDYINNRYDDIINDTDNIFKELKDELNIKTYNKLLELYDRYKYFIKRNII